MVQAKIMQLGNNQKAGDLCSENFVLWACPCQTLQYPHRQSAQISLQLFRTLRDQLKCTFGAVMGKASDVQYTCHAFKLRQTLYLERWACSAAASRRRACALPNDLLLWSCACWCAPTEHILSQKLEYAISREEFIIVQEWGNPWWSQTSLEVLRGE